MGFGGYQVAKAGPVGANTGLSRDGDAIARSMQQFLESRQRQKGELGSYQATPLPRNPDWAENMFGPNYPLVGEPVDRPRPDTEQPDPRLSEYPVSWNTTIGKDRHVPWDILRASADQPLFRACIELRKTELSSMDWGIRVNPKVASRMATAQGKAKDQVASDLRKKHQDEIEALEQWWQWPDRKNGRNFAEWVGLAMDEQLVHDGLAIYPWQTYGNTRRSSPDGLKGLWIVDGSTIMPLLDETGGRPEAPFPAYQQILYGFPRGEFTAQTYVDAEKNSIIPGGMTQGQLVYRRRTPRVKTPYGYSATEQALLDGLLYSRRFGWMVSEYTEGVMPTSFIESDGQLDWSPDQLLEYERLFNNRMAGMTAERMKAQFLPPGLRAANMSQVGERYKPEYDLHLVKLVAMHFACTASELGFNDTGGLGSAGYHEGQDDINYRRGRLPDLKWFADMLTEISITYLGMDPDLEFYFLGLEAEDEAAADELEHNRVADGRQTLNEARARLGYSAYGFKEADMPQLQTARGVVFLDGASDTAPPGVLIEPASELNTMQGGQPSSPTQRRPLGSGGGTKPVAKPSSASKELLNAAVLEADARKEFDTYCEWIKKPRKKPFHADVMTEQLAKQIGVHDLIDPEWFTWKAPTTGPAKNWSMYTDLN